MDTTRYTTGPVVPTIDEAELTAMIRERAHELSLIRQDENREGSPEEDWAQAAAEIEPFVNVTDA